MSETTHSPTNPSPETPPDAGSGPSVCEIASGVCVGSAGERGVVVLGAGGSEAGVPTESGDLYDSGIHRIDMESALAAAAAHDELDGKHCRPGEEAPAG